MERKPPRRTRERILELSLRLFNDFGEPNVNTTIIADEMKISPGNLYYHFKNKDDIVHSIFQQFEREIDKLITVPPPATARDLRMPDVEDVWLFLHVLFELVWKYRFFYRDLSNLLINSRVLELRFKKLLADKVEMARWLCEGMARNGQLKASRAEIDALATNMVVVTTWWLSFEYVTHARRFTEPDYQAGALARGAYHVMALTGAYLVGDARALFERLARNYLAE
jgi:AcrR family transcriptional regulator